MKLNTKQIEILKDFYSVWKNYDKSPNYYSDNKAKFLEFANLVIYIFDNALDDMKDNYKYAPKNPKARKRSMAIIAGALFKNVPRLAKFDFFLLLELRSSNSAKLRFSFRLTKGNQENCNHEKALDNTELIAFIKITQPSEWKALISPAVTWKIDVRGE